MNLLSSLESVFSQSIVMEKPPHEEAEQEPNVLIVKESTSDDTPSDEKSVSGPIPMRRTSPPTIPRVIERVSALIFIDLN